SNRGWQNAPSADQRTPAGPVPASCCAQHNLSAAQRGLQLVQGGFDLPSLVIKGGQLLGRRRMGIEDGGDQAVQRLGVGDVFQAVIDDADHHPVTLLPPVLRGGVNAAEIGAVGQAFFHIQTCILARAPQQIRARRSGCPPEFVTGEEPSALQSIPWLSKGITFSASVSSSVAYRSRCAPHSTCVPFS